jgi:Zn-dependent protease with chaperone function
MYFGLQSLSDFPFVTVGFFIVAIGAMGFVATFILGPSKGGHAALKFSRIWAVIVVTSVVSVVLYALATLQWQKFLRVFGFGPLLEMGVLAFGWIIIMWFMATQYAIGRITLDEKFGSSKELRKQLIEQARQAQYEVYRRAEQEMKSGQEKQSEKPDEDSDHA